MMKKYMILLVSVFILFVAGCSDDRSYTIDEVTIDATINEDGTISVRELFTYTFSGEYNGTTRSILSDEQDFKAYDVDDTTDVTDSIDTLERLETKYFSSDNMHKIYTAAEDETKHVLYDYEINGSVKKYNDVGTILYTFFDESNESDLHNVSITIHPPSHNMSEETHAFLHANDTDNLRETSDGIHYETDLLEKGDSAPVRLIFPSEALPEQNVTKETNMKDELLAEETQLQERYANLDDNMSAVKPFIWAAFPLIIILIIIYINIHPSTRSSDEEDDPTTVQDTLETSDPLFVTFLSKNDASFITHIPDESLIAALFSLRQRGIITIEKETKDDKKPKDTFRFTWRDHSAEVDDADDHLHHWLFAKHDQNGAYFYLEDITHQKEENNTTRTKKISWFKKGLKTWKKRVLQREDYQNIKKPFRLFPLFSIILTTITYTLFFYLLQIDTISQTLRWILPLVLGSVAVISLIFIWQRMISSIFHLLTLITMIIWFTKTSATLWGIGLIFLILIFISIIPSQYFQKHTEKTKRTINQAKKMFKNGTYPISEDPDLNERRLEYAILLEEGKTYGNRFEEETLPTNMVKYPLLINPTFADKMFGVRSVALSTGSGGGGGSSSGGGGGAGAF